MVANHRSRCQTAEGRVQDLSVVDADGLRTCQKRPCCISILLISPTIALNSPSSGRHSSACRNTTSNTDHSKMLAGPGMHVSNASGGGSPEQLQAQRLHRRSKRTPCFLKRLPISSLSPHGRWHRSLRATFGASSSRGTARKCCAKFSAYKDARSCARLTAGGGVVSTHLRDFGKHSRAAVPSAPSWLSPRPPAAGCSPPAPDMGFVCTDMPLLGKPGVSTRPLAPEAWWCWGLAQPSNSGRDLSERRLQTKMKRASIEDRSHSQDGEIDQRHPTVCV